MNAKEKIKINFKRLFTKKPIYKISVTELAQSTGVNRKNFYRYFYTMDDVLKSIETDLLADLNNAINPLQPFNIQDFLKALNSLVKKNEVFYHTLIVRNTNSFFLRDAQNILKRGLAQSLNLELSEPSTNLQLEFISGDIIQLYTYWLSNDHGVSLSELVSLVSHQPKILKQFFNSVELKQSAK